MTWGMVVLVLAGAVGVSVVASHFDAKTNRRIDNIKTVLDQLIEEADFSSVKKRALRKILDK